MIGWSQGDVVIGASVVRSGGATECLPIAYLATSNVHDVPIPSSRGSVFVFFFIPFHKTYLLMCEGLLAT